MKPLPIDSGPLAAYGTVRLAPMLSRERFAAAMAELGIRDDTLLALQFDVQTRLITVTEQVLDSEGRVILGTHMVREIALAAPEILKG